MKSKWSIEKCREIAAKYSSPPDMRRGDPKAFSAAERFGWLDELFPGRKKYVRVNHLTFEDVQAVVAENRCKTKTELYRANPSVHLLAKKRGWLEVLFGKHKRYCTERTREECFEEAKKYSTLADFQKHSSGAYHRARRKGWLRELCSHMPIKDYSKKCVYRAIDYKTKSIYIGITCDFEWRWSSENRAAQRRPDVLALIESGKHEQLTGMMPSEAAARMERSLIKLYRDLGWSVLNMTNGGEVGCPRVISWTFDKCKAEAKKCKSRNDLRIACRSAYKAAIANGWINELFPCRYAKRRRLIASGQLSLPIFD